MLEDRVSNALLPFSYELRHMLLAFPPGSANDMAVEDMATSYVDDDAEWSIDALEFNMHDVLHRLEDWRDRFYDLYHSCDEDDMAVPQQADYWNREGMSLAIEGLALRRAITFLYRVEEGMNKNRRARLL